MEIVPQVHLVPGTRGANVYLIEEATLTVIDTGLHHSAEAVIHYMTRLGRRPEELTRIVLTHHHVDHAGSADELRVRTRAAILMHADELKTVRHRPERPQQGLGVIRGLVGSLVRKFTVAEGLGPAELLGGGEVLPVLGGLAVVHTPGHTLGSICLYSPQRRLVFVGDMVLNNVNRLSRPLPTYESNRALYEASLRRLASLEFDVCLFGHGPPIIEGGSRLVRRLAERPPSRFLLGRIATNLGTLFSFGRRLSRRRRDGSRR